MYSAVFLSGSSGVGKTTLVEHVLSQHSHFRLVTVRARDVHSTLPAFSYDDVINTFEARQAAQSEVFARFRDTVTAEMARAPDFKSIPIFERTVLDVVAYSLTLRPPEQVERGFAAMGKALALRSAGPRWGLTAWPRPWSPPVREANGLSAPGLALSAYLTGALSDANGEPLPHADAERAWLVEQIHAAWETTFDVGNRRRRLIVHVPLAPAHIPYNQEGRIRPSELYRDYMAYILPHLLERQTRDSFGDYDGVDTYKGSPAAPVHARTAADVHFLSPAHIDDLKKSIDWLVVR